MVPYPPAQEAMTDDADTRPFNTHIEQLTPIGITTFRTCLNYEQATVHAEYGGEKIGNVLATYTGFEWYIEDLYVEAHLRRKGIGRTLMYTLMRMCSEFAHDGFDVLPAGYANEMKEEDRITFYESLGFRLTDEAHGIYSLNFMEHYGLQGAIPA